MKIVKTGIFRLNRCTGMAVAALVMVLSLGSCHHKKEKPEDRHDYRNEYVEDIGKKQKPKKSGKSRLYREVQTWIGVPYRYGGHSRKGTDCSGLVMEVYKNVYGKEDTLVTIQIDMLLAERFGMEYVDADGQKKHPYIIHRTSLGCYERTLAYLIEKYAGALPTWMAPEQVRVLSVTDRAADYANALVAKLSELGYRAEADITGEKIGKKIRLAQMDKVPYMLVVGDRDMAENTVSVRHRAEGDLGAMSFDSFAALLKDVVDSKAKK